MTIKLHLRAGILYGCLAVSAIWPCAAQEDGLTIRVESGLVLVPVLWGGYVSCSQTRNKDFLKCSWDGAVNDHVPREARLRGELQNPDDLGLLSLKDLHIFEDGKEQRIEKTENGLQFQVVVRDNLGSHVEKARVPTGTDSTSDLPANTEYLKGGALYQFAYLPSDSTEGSCHSIRITGPHEAKLVYRKEYCFVTHSTSDLLNGASEEKMLEGYLAAGKQGSVHPKMQGASFYIEPGKARVNVDVELPFDEVKPKDLKDWSLPIDMLILAYGEDGRLIARHSEFVPADKNLVSPPWVNLDHASVAFTFVRYDAQMELPPGQYKLAFAYSHGPVRNGDTLMAYFELYEPATEQPQQALHVNYTMRIRNEQTGAVALQRVENADSWVQPGKSTIPLAEKLVLSQLHLAPGKYRFEIQATDSAGKNTPLRTAEFWID
jgi:hypothetical protein